MKTAQTTKYAPQPEQCRACFGRGYKPETRRKSGRNPHGIGFYARTCPSCGGSGTRIYARAALAQSDKGERYES